MGFKPTYEMLVLAQKIADGDVLAIKDLWELMFDVPFQPSRPIDDIGKDIADKFATYEAAQAAEKARAAKEEAPDLVTALASIVEALLGDSRSTKT